MGKVGEKLGKSWGKVGENLKKKVGKLVEIVGKIAGILKENVGKVVRGECGKSCEGNVMTVGEKLVGNLGNSYENGLKVG